MKFFKTKKADFDSEHYKKARFHYLLQILFGESLAINYCKIIAEFAPTTEARDFLLKQQSEEEIHLELLSDYVSSVDRPHVPISKHMRALHNIMDKVLEDKNYLASILVQNFIVEGLVIVLLKELKKHGDKDLSNLCDHIIKDEVSHVEFGVTELKNSSKEVNDPKINKYLINIQRRSLIRSVLLFSSLARDAKYLGIAWDDLAAETVKDYIKRIDESGLHMPWYDRFILLFAVKFLIIV